MNAKIRIWPFISIFAFVTVLMAIGGMVAVQVDPDNLIPASFFVAITIFISFGANTAFTLRAAMKAQRG